MWCLPDNLRTLGLLSSWQQMTSVDYKHSSSFNYTSSFYTAPPLFPPLQSSEKEEVLIKKEEVLIREEETSSSFNYTSSFYTAPPLFTLLQSSEKEEVLIRKEEVSEGTHQSVDPEVLSRMSGRLRILWLRLESPRPPPPPLFLLNLHRWRTLLDRKMTELRLCEKVLQGCMDEQLSTEARRLFYLRWEISKEVMLFGDELLLWRHRDGLEAAERAAMCREDNKDLLALLRKQLEQQKEDEEDMMEEVVSISKEVEKEEEKEVETEVEESESLVQRALQGMQEEFDKTDNGEPLELDRLVRYFASLHEHFQCVYMSIMNVLCMYL